MFSCLTDRTPGTVYRQKLKLISLILPGIRIQDRVYYVISCGLREPSKSKFDQNVLYSLLCVYIFIVLSRGVK